MTTDRPEIREIITKAVCGQGTYKYQRSIDLEIPSDHKSIQVLGNFISSAALDDAAVISKPPVSGKVVQVKGHYNVHVWYAYDQETCAAKTTVNFIEHIPVKTLGKESAANMQAVAKILEKPKCRKAYVKNKGDTAVIRVEIEQLLAAEVIGTTKVKVGVMQPVSASVATVKGRELLPPPKPVPGSLSPVQGNYFDLKCEEDLPDDDEDFDDYLDDYSF
ncbi:MAG: hypothetical protein CVU89_14075 [Firmicutes bacterium HGW-Firmicutes-14]|jgi:spore coat protein E|nr:MAG: hypothetical protein CVU89_14075 [Firmicutes bacterium HGW-Firmicutes-14]